MSLPVARTLRCDVLVVGGGTAGFPAAVCAARHGARTVLAERNGCLGGSATAGMVGPFMTSTTPDGRQQVVKGFFEEFVRAMEARGAAIHPLDAQVGSFSSYRDAGHRGCTTFDPEAYKSVAEKMCLDAGVKLLYHAFFLKAAVEDGRVSAAYFATKGGIWKIEAKVFVDATGDADVAWSAGVPTIFGDGAGEVMTSSLFFRVRGVDRAAMDAHDAECRARDDGAGQFYEREIAEGLKTGEFPNNRGRVQLFETLDGTWLVNMTRVEGVDATDPEQVTAAEIECREQARAIIAFLRRHVAGCANCELVETAATLGVRESRRIRAEYEATTDDAAASVRYPDSVFCCCNHMDIHHKGGIRYVVRKSEEPFFIPYRSLQAKGVSNLLAAGRCAGTERPVAAAIRVMPPCMAMGQAAGTAAALAVAAGVGPKEIDPAALVRALVADGAYLP